MPECDICGEEFDTERGLHIHQSQKHDEEVEEDVETEEEVEQSASEEQEEDDTEQEETAEEAGSTDEVVESIERETEGGLLGGFSRESIFVGGALVGIALGLVVGLFLSQGGSGFDQASPSQVQSQIEGVPGLGLSVDSVSKENGLFVVNASAQQTVGNQTISQPMTLYVSPDGNLLFPQGITFEELNQAAQQQQQAPQQPPQPPTGNTTGDTAAP